MGTTSKSNALDRAKILRAQAKELHKRNDTNFLEYYERALAECKPFDDIDQDSAGIQEDEENSKSATDTLLSEIVSVLIQEYRSRGELNKVRDLIAKYGSET